MRKGGEVDYTGKSFSSELDKGGLSRHMHTEKNTRNLLHKYIKCKGELGENKEKEGPVRFRKTLTISKANSTFGGLIMQRERKRKAKKDKNL